VIEHQATLRDWTFDKDAKMVDGLVMNNTKILSDTINVRYRNSLFQDVVLEGMVSKLDYMTTGYNKHS